MSDRSVKGLIEHMQRKHKTYAENCNAFEESSEREAMEKFALKPGGRVL